MASNTRRLKVRRALAKARAGKRRKNRLAIDGSTQPNLPLTVPNANEQAQSSKA